MLKSLPEIENPMDLPDPEGSITLENAIITAPESTVAIIKNISLQIEKGEVVGLIGPSGSGKSTLARAMVGVWELRGGAVRYDADSYSGSRAFGPVYWLYTPRC